MTKLNAILVISSLCACGGSELAATSTGPEQAPRGDSAAASAPATATVTEPQGEQRTITEQVAIRADELQYLPCASAVPAGCSMAVLDGDPTGPGMFTLRLRAPGPFTVAPHRHTGLERITVLSGTIHVGLGETLDKGNGKAFGPGDFYMNPPSAAHAVWADGPVTLQISGYGPRGFHPVDTTHAHR